MDEADEELVDLHRLVLLLHVPVLAHLERLWYVLQEEVLVDGVHDLKSELGESAVGLR